MLDARSGRARRDKTSKKVSYGSKCSTPRSAHRWSQVDGTKTGPRGKSDTVRPDDVNDTDALRVLAALCGLDDLEELSFGKAARWRRGGGRAASSCRR